MVASANETEARHIVTGTLGCPICHAEYPIENGVVDFRQGARVAEAEADSAAPTHDDALKLAALLGLSDSLGFAVLVGAWGTLAATLAHVVETPLLLVDPPHGITGAPGISVIRTDGALPLASSSARGVAVDRAERLTEAVRVMRTAGRLVAPLAVPPPADVRELARDEEVCGWESASSRRRHLLRCTCGVQGAPRQPLPRARRQTVRRSRSCTSSPPRAVSP